MEPTHLTGFLMNIFSVPFALLSRTDISKLIQNTDGSVISYKMIQLMNICPGPFFGNTDQFFDIGTDIIHTEIFGVKHKKHIVHIDGKLGKQLFTV